MTGALVQVRTSIESASFNAHVHVHESLAIRSLDLSERNSTPVSGSVMGFHRLTDSSAASSRGAHTRGNFMGLDGRQMNDDALTPQQDGRSIVDDNNNSNDDDDNDDDDDDDNGDDDSGGKPSATAQYFAMMAVAAGEKVSGYDEDSRSNRSSIPIVAPIVTSPVDKSVGHTVQVLSSVTKSTWFVASVMLDNVGRYRGGLDVQIQFGSMQARVGGETLTPLADPSVQAVAQSAYRALMDIQHVLPIIYDDALIFDTESHLPVVLLAAENEATNGDILYVDEDEGTEEEPRDRLQAWLKSNGRTQEVN